MTRVKICGLSDAETALAAVRAGADYLGFIFAPSRRQVSPEKAVPIIDTIRKLSPCPLIVGVFANAVAEEVNHTAESCQLDWVQLSGHESWDYCREIERPIIKVAHVLVGQTAAAVLAEIEAAYRLLPKNRLICLLDSAVGDAYGGTGQTFNWQVAREVTARFPVIVAGGLTPVNVDQLIKEVYPWGVDVSSGVETEGRKDTAKIKAFIEAVRKAEV